jgi:cell pole-organizing protein PopZ
MSRPEKAVEPSMEEILASIRKIISEEPIGTRPGPSDGEAPKDALGRYEPGADPALSSSPFSHDPYKLQESDAVGIDDVVKLAQGTTSDSTAGDKGRSFAKPASAEPRVSPQASNGVATGNATPTHAGLSEGAKPVLPASQRDHNGAGSASEIAGAAPRQSDDAAKAPRPSMDADAALSDARAKIERHLGTPKTDNIDRAPLPGLKSIRDAEFRGAKPRTEPDTTGKAGADGLMARVAAASARPETVPTNETAEPAKAETSVASNGAIKASADVKGPAQKPAESPAPAKPDVSKARVPDAAASPANTAKGQGVASAVGQAAANGTTAPAGERARAFEDAVAEMLRPMLRDWLDANLPRLVQQALREEMGKSSLPGKDNTGS